MDKIGAHSSVVIVGGMKKTSFGLVIKSLAGYYCMLNTIVIMTAVLGGEIKDMDMRVYPIQIEVTQIHYWYE